MNERTHMKVGDKVNFVLADGTLAPAAVKAIRPGDLLDVDLKHAGQMVTITCSPLDESGKRPDSWHPIPAQTGAKTEPVK